MNHHHHHHVHRHDCDYVAQPDACPPMYTNQPGYHHPGPQPYYPQAVPQPVIVEQPYYNRNNRGLGSGGCFAALLAGLCCGCCLENCCEDLCCCCC